MGKKNKQAAKEFRKAKQNGLNSTQKHRKERSDNGQSKQQDQFMKVDMGNLFGGYWRRKESHKKAKQRKID